MIPFPEGGRGKDRLSLSECCGPARKSAPSSHTARLKLSVSKMNAEANVTASAVAVKSKLGSQALPSCHLCP